MNVTTYHFDDLPMNIHLQLPAEPRFNAYCGVGIKYKRKGLYYTDDLQYTTCKTCRQLAIRFNRQIETQILEINETHAKDTQ